MTKRSSVLARNFFRREKVRALVPDLRLILAVATVSCETHCGVWIPGDLARDTGLDEAALAGGLADLEARGIILRDADTGEILLADFFRDNVFSGPARRGQFRGDFARIESLRLREAAAKAVLQNPGCGLEIEDICPPERIELEENQCFSDQGKAREEKGREAPSSAEGQFTCGKKQRTVVQGITVWTASDAATARSIVASWPERDVAAAINELLGQGIDPLPSRVLDELGRIAMARESQRRINMGEA